MIAMEKSSACPESADVLGVRFDLLSLNQVITYVENSLSEGRSCFIVTANPEFVLSAQHDPEYAEVLSNADISVVDGGGVLWALRFLSAMRVGNILLALPLYSLQFCVFAIQLIFGRVTFGALTCSVPGVDLVDGFCQLAEEKGLRVFFLGGHADTAEFTGKSFQKKYPRLVWASSSGAEYVSRETDTERREVLTMIRRFDPHFLFVAYGGSVFQEKWVYKAIKELGPVVAMGVGSTFDYVSRRKVRSPVLFRAFGMEWLWRLIREPRRWRRIFRAVILFPLEVFLYKLRRM